MKTLKTTFSTKFFATLVALTAGFLNTGAAQADHDYNILRAKADAVFHTMIDLDRTLNNSYYRSRVFGELVATSRQIKAKATWLRGMAYRGSSCQWTIEIDRLDALVHELESLLDVAHGRADRRLDPPIAACRVTVAEQVNSMVELIHCMQDALVTAPVIIRKPPVVVPHNGHYSGYPAYRDGGYSRGHDNGYYDPSYRSASRNNSRYGGSHYGGSHYGGGQFHGSRNGNVHVDGGGVTIGGRGGLSFHIKF